jgi:Fic family protein
MAKKQITPFKPRSFPPRNLKKRSFAPLLQKANAALTELGTSLKTIRIPPSLLKQEAIDSIESQKKGSPGIHVQDYLAALHFASKEIIKAPFSKKMLCEIHQILKKTPAKSYRTRQNWIGPEGCKIDQAYFYPPAPKEVGPLMGKLIRYMRSNPEEPLLQLALIFAQLLIIHPFMDGNGRIARILVPLFLYKKKILPIPFLFLSSYFRKHRLKYFQTLFSTTDENNWEDWIVFFLEGIIQTIPKKPQELAPRPRESSRG